MSAARKPSRLGRWLWVACAALAVGAFAAWYFLPIERWIEAFVGFVKSLGVWGVLAFALAYLVVVLLLGPASVMSIAAGVAFGLWGVPFVLVVGTTAGALAFLIARYVARERVMEALQGHPNFQAVGRAIDAEGWKVVGLIRLSPPVPFAVTSYFFGVTNVGFWTFVLVTFVGIIPATLRLRQHRRDRPHVRYGRRKPIRAMGLARSRHHRYRHRRHARHPQGAQDVARSRRRRG